jgi:hypothetical protein
MLSGVHECGADLVHLSAAKNIIPFLYDPLVIFNLVGVECKSLVNHLQVMLPVATVLFGGMVNRVRIFHRKKTRVRIAARTLSVSRESG